MFGIGILLGIYSSEKIEDDFENYLNQFELIKPYGETLAIISIVIMLTFLSLVLDELVPKRIGLTMPKDSKDGSLSHVIISLIAAPSNSCYLPSRPTYSLNY